MRDVVHEVAVASITAAVQAASGIVLIVSLLRMAGGSPVSFELIACAVGLLVLTISYRLSGGLRK